MKVQLQVQQTLFMAPPIPQCLQLQLNPQMAVVQLSINSTVQIALMLHKDTNNKQIIKNQPNLIMMVL